MKTIFYILIILLIAGCNNPRHNQKSANESLELLSEPDKNLEDTLKVAVDKICSAVDFMKLSQKEIQITFFHNLDSIRKVQYPANDQENCNSVDMTPYLLNDFLKSIDEEAFQKSGEFECVYNFNIACPDFTDSEICKDKISIKYFEKTCCFRLVIENIYMVEGDCIGGSQVVYGFDIQNDRIVNFSRQEAG